MGRARPSQVRTLYADTNVFVRLLTGDPPAHARSVVTALTRAGARGHPAILHPIVVAELAHVLGKVYGLDRMTVADRLQRLVAQPDLEVVELDAVQDALTIFRDTKMDLVDAFLSALALGAERGAVLSFDKDYDRANVPRLDPSAAR